MKSLGFPHRLHPALYAGIGLILISTLTRIGLAVYSDASLSLGALLQVFVRGLWFDVNAAVFAATPMVIWLAVAPTRLARTWPYRGATLVAFFFKYTDYALGRLIAGARQHTWFKDTVFVITADHGANARGSSQIPVDKYRIPVFFYSPAHVAPRRVDRLMSQIDIAPTLLGLLDFAYCSKFIGHDLLRTPPSADRAYVANFQTLGYLKGDQLLVLQPKRKVTQFRLQGEQLRAGASVDPDLKREGIAFYQVASDLFRHGLYDDEEQKPPEMREVPRVPRRVAHQTLR